MADVGTYQPAAKPTAGRPVATAVAAVALLASAAAHGAWIFAAQGLKGSGDVIFERLLARLGGGAVAGGGAMAAGVAGGFLLYLTRWPVLPTGSGLAGRERRRVLLARVLLSLAVSAILVAIPAHGFFYLFAWPAACEEFCGLPALLLLHAAGVVALTTGLAGLVMVRAERYLRLWVGVALGIVTFVEPWVTLWSMWVPAVGVVLNTAGIAGLLAALTRLIRARQSRMGAPGSAGLP